MTDIVGGLRARLKRESLFQLLEGGLTDLGWFNAGPFLPITLVPVGQDQDQQIIINTVALSDANDREGDIELGSNLTEQTWQFYVDFFAEDDAIGLHLIKDVQDILRGRFSNTITDPTHAGPNFGVYDYRQATPTVLFHCEIQNVDTDKAHGFLKPWLEHWYSCSFEVIDVYADEAYAQPVLTDDYGQPILIV